MHVQMMRDALLVAIDLIEQLPHDGKTIKVWLPDEHEKDLIIAQLKKAISGPSFNDNMGNESA